MTKLSNNTQMPLTIAVWMAASDGYDLVPKPNMISATSLQMPLRARVLSTRIEEQEGLDVDMLVASKLGTAAHTAMELAWLNHYKEAMAALDYPQHVIDKMSVNPDVPKQYGPDSIDVYLERRTNKIIDGYEISGKFDVVLDGELHDLKTTKVYSYISGSNEGDYRKQGSIYRWLNPDIITSDYLCIDYLFTDWRPMSSASNKEYPPARCLTKKLPLYSMAETEAYIRERIAEMKKYMESDQDDLPKCTPVELWQNPSKFAYYKDPNKTAKATKLFDLMQDAQIRNSNDGGRGMIIERKSEPTRCYYCRAADLCTQAEEFRQQGLLK